MNRSIIVEGTECIVRFDAYYISALKENPTI